jgi:hypothetical protein
MDKLSMCTVSYGNETPHVKQKQLRDTMTYEEFPSRKFSDTQVCHAHPQYTSGALNKLDEEQLMKVIQIVGACRGHFDEYRWAERQNAARHYVKPQNYGMMRALDMAIAEDNTTIIICHAIFKNRVKSQYK